MLQGQLPDPADNHLETVCMTNGMFVTHGSNQLWSICVKNLVAAMRLCTIAENVAQSTTVQIMLPAVSRQIGDLFLVALRSDDHIIAYVQVALGTKTSLTNHEDGFP